MILGKYHVILNVSKVANLTNVKIERKEVGKMIRAYCRISRKTQNIERQIRNIKEAYPEAIIYQEAFTGTKVTGRKQFEKLIKDTKTGDTIVFDSVSRMSRSAEEGIEQYFEWYNQGVNLIFLKESYINTDVYKSAFGTISKTGVDIADIYIDATNQVLELLAQKQIEEAFKQAEKEVTDLQQRTREGIQTAKAHGKQIGQVRGATLNVKKKSPIKDEILKKSKAFGGTYTDTDLIKVLGIARNTYYKYKKELLAEENN